MDIIQRGAHPIDIFSAKGGAFNKGACRRYRVDLWNKASGLRLIKGRWLIQEDNEQRPPHEALAKLQVH
jgi:hypothetical protein